MRAYDKDIELAIRADRHGIDLSSSDARTLRRAEMTLSRWAERECGDGSDWHVERDGEGLTWSVYHGNSFGINERRHRCPDLEAGALRRVDALCKRLGLHYYHQTDPRGCLLYVSREPLNDQNYSSAGVPCCVIGGVA